MSVSQKIGAKGTKKILTLDGGGIRGMITVEILRRMETLLRKEYGGDENFVLGDYFDYISGTSTGAIIAACLSLGWSVERISRFYSESGEKMFDKASLLKRFKYQYEDTELRKTLQQEFGARTTLGSPKLRTLLMMVMRNVTTDSPWPVSNNPAAKYNQAARGDCNLNLPLWQLVRASTAAPVYFPPEKVRVGARDFIFVDGGITMYNNPAFQTFLMATLGPYRLNWETGADKMLIISLGTGTSPDANNDLSPGEMNLIYNATSLPSALMLAALNEQDTLCRIFGRCLNGEELDREIGDLIDRDGSIHWPLQEKLFTYSRYNAELSRSGLDRLGLQDIDPQHVQKLDSIAYVGELQRVGKAVAKQVTLKHFAGFL
ncbi:MAG: patatin-like phospholipase family protein [Gammaproteobacteria bacterium]|nr:patatin-like phospholipase family protein [Gammaproteobacteria bacterium]